MLARARAWLRRRREEPEPFDRWLSRHPLPPPDNEVLITPEVLEQLLSEGGIRNFSVEPGPAPEARIVAVRWDASRHYPLIALVYDRPVKEPVMRVHAEP